MTPATTPAVTQRRHHLQRSTTHSARTCTGDPEGVVVNDHCLSKSGEKVLGSFLAASDLSAPLLQLLQQGRIGGDDDRDDPPAKYPISLAPLTSFGCSP
jgi:hypothetical protein